MKKIRIIISVFAIIVILLIIFFMFPLLNPKYKINSIKTFSEDPSFVFDYPEFKNWEVKEILKQENRYIFHLNYPDDIDFAYPPIITIYNQIIHSRQKMSFQEKNHSDFKVVLKNKKINKYGVNCEFIYFPSNYIEGYEPKGNWDAMHFYKTDLVGGVLIDISSIPDGKGFLRDVFIKKVIETFRFIECGPELLGAEKLSDLSDLIEKDIRDQSTTGNTEINAVKATIDWLEQENENPDNFYSLTEGFEKSDATSHLIIFHLFYKGDFEIEICGGKGNLSGKSRDIVYDILQKKIIKDDLWQ